VKSSSKVIRIVIGSLSDHHMAKLAICRSGAVQFEITGPLSSCDTVGLTDTGGGAPRSVKMGTTLSPWCYDAATRHALQPAILRRPATLHYARRGPPDIAGRSGYPSIATMPILP
jgi:hypothetical protein